MTDDSAHPMFVALGREMKIARERSKLTQLELADLIHYSDSLISSVENGRRPPTDEFLALCDDSLNTGGLLTRLLETARVAAQQEMLPSWLREWTEYEREASALRWYEAALIPGLLQTPQCLETLTRSIWPLADDEEIARKVAARLERCEILYRKNPPRFFGIIDEAVLRRPVGGHLGYAQRRCTTHETVNRLYAKNDMTDILRFRKSSRSNGSNGGACVEVADNLAAVVGVRDSKDPHGPALHFVPSHWSAFIADVKAGRFDL